jgi:Leucine-rich repeat (LRR) protein
MFTIPKTPSPIIATTHTPATIKAHTPAPIKTPAPTIVKPLKPQDHKTQSIAQKIFSGIGWVLTSTAKLLGRVVMGFFSVIGFLFSPITSIFKKKEPTPTLLALPPVTLALTSNPPTIPSELDLKTLGDTKKMETKLDEWIDQEDTEIIEEEKKQAAKAERKLAAQTIRNSAELIIECIQNNKEFPKGSRTLNLERKNLSSLPDVFELPVFKLYLKKLVLSNNKLTKLPNSIGSLSKLITFDLDYNQFKEFPDAITHLKKIQQLDLTGNKFNTIPESLRNLTNLRQLRLGKNELEGLPDIFVDFPNLVTLNLCENPQLSSLPPSLFNCNSLKYVKMDETGIPKETIDKLTDLCDTRCKANTKIESPA